MLDAVFCEMPEGGLEVGIGDLEALPEDPERLGNLLHCQEERDVSRVERHHPVDVGEARAVEAQGTVCGVVWDLYGSREPSESSRVKGEKIGIFFSCEVNEIKDMIFIRDAWNEFSADHVLLLRVMVIF